MSGYRRGDVRTSLGPLRLSVAALAEMADRLDADSPAALSRRLRRLEEADARIVLEALLRPAGKADAVGSLASSAVAGLMPDAAICISQALSAPEEPS
ncbi:MAG: hypothetical protein WBG08_06235 [Litorimonas sp.]